MNLKIKILSFTAEVKWTGLAFLENNIDNPPKIVIKLSLGPAISLLEIYSRRLKP